MSGYRCGKTSTGLTLTVNQCYIAVIWAVNTYPRAVCLDIHTEPQVIMGLFVA